MKNALVIARYEENVDWLLKVPASYAIYLYNKGPELEDQKILERCTAVIDLDNTGRESHTYLHHIQSEAARDTEKTVFCQGNPFEHSPDFLALLTAHKRWLATQNLSYWLETAALPPAHLLQEETREHLGKCRVRSELFALGTWAALTWHDPGGVELGQKYHQEHRLNAGENIAAHFLEMCGLEVLAKKAHLAQAGRFSYGAIFATETNRMRGLKPKALDRMSVLSRAFWVYGFIFEKLWLHLLGHPFITIR